MEHNLISGMPKWGEKGLGTIKVKSPNRIYNAEKSENCTYLSIECSDCCGAKLDIFYHGLNHFLPETYFYENSLHFIPSYSKEKDKDCGNNILMDLSNETFVGSVKDFISNASKAFVFKQDLIKGILFKLSFKYTVFEVDLLIKRNDDNKIIILLFQLSENLAKRVLLLNEARNYKEALGITHIFTEDFCVDDIKEGNESSNKILLNDLFVWVKNLFYLNQIDFDEHKLNLWVIKF
ncbi:MAG: hypothetical protein WCI41_01780 [bacterium]